MDFTAFFPKFLAAREYAIFGKKVSFTILAEGGGYFEDRTIPKVSSDFLWPKEQHLGVPKFLKAYYFY